MMRTRQQHCKPISLTPALATTGAQVKFAALGEFVTYLESVRRSAPWGLAFPKGGVPDDGGGDGDGGGGDGDGGLGGL